MAMEDRVDSPIQYFWGATMFLGMGVAGYNFLELLSKHSDGLSNLGLIGLGLIVAYGSMYAGILSSHGQTE